ncbi:MAG: response regulator [Anaerolineae bacterium]|nr:MAG: response regulator [Anaerolineae bacterium]
MSARHILIIEDDSDNTALLRLLLERQGYQVSLALNGEQGLQKVRSLYPDLVVLDLDMPVMDGWSVLREIKTDTHIRHIPVIVVTAHLMPDEKETVLQAGASGYVLKPFSVQGLVGEVERLLK